MIGPVVVFSFTMKELLRTTDILFTGFIMRKENAQKSKCNDPSLRLLDLNLQHIFEPESLSLLLLCLIPFKIQEYPYKKSV